MGVSNEDTNKLKRTTIPWQKTLIIGLILIGGAILGVATGIFIMKIKVKEMKLQNEQLKTDLKLQEKRATDGINWENNELIAKSTLSRIKSYMKYTFPLCKQIGGTSFVKNIQGDPNQNLVFQMALPLKQSISDPMFVKSKLV